MSDFCYRPIIPEDDQPLAEIILAGLKEHDAAKPGFACYDPEFYKLSEYYQQPRASYWTVTTNAGAVIGGGGYGPLKGNTGDVCEIQKFYLKPEYRGHGIARKLLELSLAGAKNDRYQTAYLETLASMDDARRLYERSGFAFIKGPLGDTGHFGCNSWMTKDLSR